MSLVRIYETSDVQEALIIRATLEAYGIFVSTAGIELAQQIPGLLPSPFGTIGILVSDLDEETARQLLQQSKAAGG